MHLRLDVLPFKYKLAYMIQDVDTIEYKENLLFS